MAVDPGDARYTRQRTLAGFGLDAQAALATAHVVVLGAGGLGSTVLPALAAAGIGSLTIVDHDTVDVTNLPRQTLYAPADVGRPKADAAADALAALAPDVAIAHHGIRFSPDTATQLLEGADLIVDATDDLGARYLANDEAAARGIPLVWGSALRFGAQVGVAWDARGVDYRDLFPEPPDDPDDTCEVAGVLPTACAVAGAMMATEALKVLTGVGTPLLGRVALYDALSGTTREVTYARDFAAKRPARTQRPAAPVITPRELADATEPPLLLDVREPSEFEVAALPDAVLIPLGELSGRVGELPRNASIVVYCHHGVRSARGAAILQAAGFADVRHLAGGIDAWSTAVDSAVPRY